MKRFCAHHFAGGRTTIVGFVLSVSLGLAAVPRAAEPERNGDVPAWWSLRPLQKPAPPAILSAAAADWIRTPIDRFILAKLADQRLAPSPPADKRTLLRRVMFDLVGLPPTPSDAAEFLADQTPDAYERLVDRLLASPQYGERWARHWMDVVHYAETHGHDQDRPRPNAWPYRDYLIRSFNDDKPYARFIEEQIAGDALLPDDPEGFVAMGFLATGPWDESSLRDIREDAVDREIARYLDRDDVVTTAMSTFVSSSVHCARCHDHKLDPISQEEYYRLQAVFAGVEKADRAYDADPALARHRRELAARLAELSAPNVAENKFLAAPQVRAKVAGWERRLAETTISWQSLDAESMVSTGGATLTKLDDGSILSEGACPETDTYTLRISTAALRLTGLKLELLPDDSLPQKGPGRQENGNLHLNELRVAVARHGATEEGDFVPMKLVRPRADFNQAGWSVEMAVDGKAATAWGIHPAIGKPHLALFEFEKPIEFPEGITLRIQLEQSHGRGHLIGRFRLTATDAPLPLPPIPAVLPQEIAEPLRIPAAERNDVQWAVLGAYLLRQEAEAQLAALPEQKKVYSATSKFQPDGSFRPRDKPQPVKILKRGDIHQPGETAEPGTIDGLPGLESRFALTDPEDEASRRVALARWLSDRRNVLTWRSIVNRVWHYHFGRGLVDTPNEFGRLGSLPSHPELLDWLAVTFQESDGSMKALHRMIVTSAVYRQSSQSNPAFVEIDGDNKFLWRMNRSRLDAESIRDAVLSISGKLDPTPGGPSVKQFVQTPGIHVTPMVDYLGFDVDRPENYRRSVYRFIFRTLPDPFMETLDCADSSQLTPVRSASVTALQALTMLNNRFVVRQSEHIAERLSRLAAEPADQVRLGCELIFGRPPTDGEVALVAEYAAKHGMANAVRMLLNSNEFMFVN